jgi:rare lipoprotein A
MKRFLIAAILIAGCTTTTTTTTAPPPQPAPPQPLAGMSDKHGLAGWYGQEFAGRTTANGEIFDPLLMTAAHRSLPFGTKLRVTHRGQSVVVTINDRGPFIKGRVLDLSTGAARAIGLTSAGVGRVTAEVI